MLFTATTDWDTARKTCQSVAGIVGGDLTALATPTDNNKLAAWMASKGVDEAWIGLTADSASRTDPLVLGKKPGQAQLPCLGKRVPQHVVWGVWLAYCSLQDMAEQHWCGGLSGQGSKAQSVCL
jgi:hypothetical protein